MNYKCFECGSREDLHHHHVVPRMRGGTRTIPLCPLCHAKVHGRKSMHTGTLIKEALKKKAETHKLGSAAPYGYDFNEDRTDFVTVEEEEKVLQLAKEFAKSLNKKWGLYTKLALHLNEMGIKSRSGGEWSPQSTNKVFHKHLERFFSEEK